MITGFNTDIEYGGVVYHVQTEDTGLGTQIILSLVYVGGAILASKRSSYSDLVSAGYDQDALIERLQRQHKLICAAIRAGRIEDLKRMGQREAAPPAIQPGAPEEPPPPVIENKPSLAKDSKQTVKASPTLPPKAAPVNTARLQPPAPPARTPEPTLPPPKVSAPAEGGRESLQLSLLEEQELRAGEAVTLRVHVSRGTDKEHVSVPGASITLKVLGTNFRTLVISDKTDQNGIALMHAWLPHFTTGRAAILIRAVSNGREAELRRIIKHS